jgi:hypothetical protein
MNWIASRSERWGAKEETPRFAAKQPVQALPMSLERERAAISEGRAQAALTTSTMAWRAASDRLDACRRARRLSTAASVAVGLSGIGCLVFIIYNPQSSLMELVFTALGAAAACAPSLHMMLRVGEEASIEARALVETEKISMLIAQAKLVGQTIVAASDDNGLSKIKHEVLDIMLNGLEKASFAQKRRASVLRDDPANAGRIRRDARIIPINKRVTVSIGDHSKYHVRIIDVSLSGVAVEGVLLGVGVGSDAVVGARKAKVVRLLPEGAAFQFATPIGAEQFDENIVL